MSLRSPIFNTFSYFYGVNQNEMVKKLEDFETFQQFFTREVKPREYNDNPAELVSPADSRVLAIKKVEANDVYLIKGKTYGLCEYYEGKPDCQYDADTIDSLFKKNKENDLYSIILYLAPGDYHRFHSPTAINLTGGRHIPGVLKPVHKTSIKYFGKVYERNERVIVDGDWEHGKISLGFVGAVNVGSMTINFDKELKTNRFDNKDGLFMPVNRDYKGISLAKGEEIGRFNFGSSVIALVETPKGFEFDLETEQKVRYGDVIGRFK